MLSDHGTNNSHWFRTKSYKTVDAAERLFPSSLSVYHAYFTSCAPPYSPSVISLMFGKSPSFDTLPFDIKQLVLLELDSEGDLLCLGLTNKGWKDLIIPYHLEYRTLRLSQNRPYVWRHLAKKAHLAARIRTVVLESGFILDSPGWETREILGCRKDAYPRAAEEDGGASRPWECHEVRKAFASMRSLETFHWEGPKREIGYRDWLTDNFPPAISLSIFLAQAFQGLLQANSVRRLWLRDAGLGVFGPQDEDATSVDYPLQKLRRLKSVSLILYCPLTKASREDAVCKLLKSNLRSLTALQLNVRYTPQSVMSLTFPNLRTLSLVSELLTPRARATAARRQFLLNNPTVEELELRVPFGGQVFNSPPEQLLPKLRNVCLRKGGRSGLTALLQSRAGQRPLVSLSGLSLDEETMQILLSQRKFLADLDSLTVESVAHPCMLTRLGSIFQNLKTLRFRRERCEPIALDIDDFLPFISSFTALRSLLGVAVRMETLRVENFLGALSKARCSLGFVAVVVFCRTTSDTFFRVYPEKKVWVEVSSLEDLFHGLRATRTAEMCHWCTLHS